jgi:hypothetical protein
VKGESQNFLKENGGVYIKKEGMLNKSEEQGWDNHFDFQFSFSDFAEYVFSKFHLNFCTFTRTSLKGA